MDNPDMDGFLRKALGKMDIPYDEAQCGQLIRFVQQIELFNPTFKLVGDSGMDLWTRHVLDSLSGYHTLGELATKSGKPDFSVADLGSGAGFPGIPLAIVRPELRFTLIERMQRRVGFLRNALAATGLVSSVGLIDTDIKDVRRTFDLVVMRAFHPLCDIVSEAFRLLVPGGSIMAYKATDEYLDEELRRLEQLFDGKLETTVTDVRVPGLDGKRKLCLIRKPND